MSTFANQPDKSLPPPTKRALVKQLDEKRLMVTFRNADYMITEITTGVWRVFGRKLKQDIQCEFGKEDAIAWIESNC